MWHYKILTCQFYEWINFVLENINISFIALELAQTPKLLGFLLYNVSNICKYHAYVVSQSCWLFAIPWTVGLQAPLFMGFPRHKYWIGLPFPSTGDLPNPGMESVSLALSSVLFTSEHLGSPHANTILFP